MMQKDSGIPSMVTGEKRGIMSMLFILLLCAFVVVSGLAIYFYLQASKASKTPQELSQEQIQQAVAKVSKLIMLPEGETPTLTVLADKDIELVKSQPFFVKAHAGDELLVYTNAKEAILYNPTANIIVGVAPVTIGATPAGETAPKTDTTKKP